MKIKIIITSLLGFLFVGCLGPNLRTFRNPNIEALASRNNNSWQYYEVTIGTPEKPFNNNLFFSIQTEEGSVFSSRDFNINTIQKFAKLTKTNQPFETYRVGPYAFIFTNNNLVQVRLFSWRDSDVWHRPTIISNDNNKILFPMDEKSLIKLFDQPESIQDKFVW